MPHDESIHGERALLAGARGYAMKSERRGNHGAIREVLRGEIYLSKRMRALVVEKFLHIRLAATGSGSPSSATVN